MFSTPESGKISDRWTSVMIEGGADLDAEGRAFMARYGLGGYPSLLAVTAGGALVDGDLLEGRMRSAEQLYGAMQQAEEVNQQFLALRTKLSAAGDAASLEKLGDLSVDRLELAEGAALYATAFEEAPTEALVQKRLVLYARMGELESETALLDEAVSAFPEARERMGWLMRRATIHLPQTPAPEERDESARLHVEALEGLREELAAAGDVEGEATVRIAIARLQHGLRRLEESQANLDWVFEHAPNGRAARILYLTLAQRALEKRDADGARAQAGKVLEMAPESDEAVQAHMLLGDLAYGAHDLDAMEKHFQAVVDLAPDTNMAQNARSALEAIERLRERDGN